VFDCVLIHYGEIGLKGQNRPLFEKKLVENIGKSLEGLDHGRIARIQGRIVLELTEHSDVGHIEARLKKVFGVAWCAFCLITDARIEAIKELVRNRFQFEVGTTVRVSCNRADKMLPFTSMDVNSELGAFLVERFGVKIFLKEPQKEISVELVKGKAYVFDRKVRGLYGLPVGVSAKILHLLSGGIDSPVAAWLLMKRGCEVDFLHFHPFKKFDPRKNAKILELVKVLVQYCFSSKVFFAPFYPFEVVAVDVPTRYRLIIFRRFMVRVAERIAHKYGAKALGSGENLAQVSSQTVENMVAAGAATSMQIFRPLISYEKNETVNLAKKIGVFEISTKPYKDCCSLFIAKHPVTKANLEIVRSFERKLNLDDTVEETLGEIEMVNVEQIAR
jgi:thiamine biosynthesis protein ThiI